MTEEDRSLDHQQIETIYRMAAESSEFFQGLTQALEQLKELLALKEALPA